jgi:hypothetical protein
MNEPDGPDARHTDVFGFDEVWEFNVEMIPDQEGIDAVIAWAKAKSTSIDSESAAENDADAEKSDDPDRPAA